MNFSIEQLNLMCIFDTTNRSRLMAGIRESLPYIYEPELRTLTVDTLVELGNITDEEFSALDLDEAILYEKFQ